MIISISVILPVYNCEKYIAGAIESILSQSFQDFELIVINDCSFDNSKEIIHSFSDSRIKIFDNEINRGLIYTLNRGIDESNGKYIARMDADDISLPLRLKKQFNYMEQNPDTAVCGAYAEYFGTRTGIWKFPVSNDEIKCRLMWGSGIIHPTALIRKTILTNHSIKFKEEYIAAEDHKLWVEIGRVSQLHNLPEVLLKYRIHNQQITATKKKIMDETRAKIVSEQLVSSGLEISENDFPLLLKFTSYEYDFSFPELKRLIQLYSHFILKNNITREYLPSIINPQVEERIFEACYFSTKKCGLKAIGLFRKHFGFNEISAIKKMKFYFKALMA